MESCAQSKGKAKQSIKAAWPSCFFFYNFVGSIQVPRRAASLNSGDIFVLETPQIVYLWIGRVSTVSFYSSLKIEIFDEVFFC